MIDSHLMHESRFMKYTLTIKTKCHFGNSLLFLFSSTLQNWIVESDSNTFSAKASNRCSVFDISEYQRIYI